MTAPSMTADGTAVAAPQMRFSALSWCARLNLLLLGLGTAALAWLLWPEWRHNPDLSHGLFMPLVFLLLLHEARRQLGPSVAISLISMPDAVGFYERIGMTRMTDAFWFSRKR